MADPGTRQSGYEFLYIFRNGAWSCIDANHMRDVLLALVPPPVTD